MTEQEAIDIFNKEIPKASDQTLSVASNARNKKLSKKEAFKLLVSNHEFLDPLLFILFTSDSDLSESISYLEYVVLMRQKAMKSRNQALLNLSNAALVIAEERGI